MTQYKAIDLYSGIGGWSLGIRASGIDVVASFEWWNTANNTYGRNFGCIQQDIDIRKLELSSLPSPGTIDFVIGSPPCTQFSYANKGGNGDIVDGLIDIRKMLEIVEYLKPKYWMMENVPRVSQILTHELSDAGSLSEFAHLVTVNEVFDMSDFGLPQARKRMVAGNYPLHILNSYKGLVTCPTLEEVVKSLSQEFPSDPNYGFSINSNELTDHIKEDILSPEELRMNSEAKSFHAVYNKMSFPDSGTRVARTITATCTRVSRESIVIFDQELSGYRRLTTREKATLQGFPITYQFYANSYSDRQKTIGNAIPPFFSYLLGNCLIETPKSQLILPKQLGHFHSSKEEPSISISPEKPKTKYAKARSFRAAIPGLRYGSGVRFELKNTKVEEYPLWMIDFYYGTSKNIIMADLGFDRVSRIVSDFGLDELWTATSESLKPLSTALSNVSPISLQMSWTHETNGYGPYNLVDDIGIAYSQLCKSLNDNDLRLLIINCARALYPAMNSQKSDDTLFEMLCGGLIASLFNKIFNESYSRAFITPAQQSKVTELTLQGTLK